MKEINNNGEFTTRHEGIRVTVMFREDYARKMNSTKYKVKKKIADNELHELKIQGRKRMNSLIVIGYSKFKLFEGRLLSDEEGVFEIFDGYKWNRVMFADQYAAKYGYSSKQALEYHIGKSVEALRLQRMNGEYLNLLICKQD